MGQDLLTGYAADFFDYLTQNVIVPFHIGNRSVSLLTRFESTGLLPFGCVSFLKNEFSKIEGSFPHRVGSAYFELQTRKQEFWKFICNTNCDCGQAESGRRERLHGGHQVRG